ncbi:MAG: aminopeptidase P family protein [Chitinophagaceae bacterium]|nr:aminopeptidase P family protein [Chitinophagaceae bacterium]
MFTTAVYTQRREKLKHQLKTGVILLPGNKESSMNYLHNFYPFRQDSTFLYFTGLDIPDIISVIDIDHDWEILFGDELTVEDIVWTGHRKSVREMADDAGIATVEPLENIDPWLKRALTANRQIHYLPPYRPEQTMHLGEWLQIPLEAVALRTSVPFIRAVVAQRSVKTEEETAQIERAVNTTNAMQLLAMQAGRAGANETEIAGRLQGLAISAGGDLSFPTILTINGQILHNHYGNNVVHDGQLLLCDCGAETAMHYAGDVTRTFPVSGKFTMQQKEIYDIVLSAHEAALGALQPGVLYKDVHLLACRKIAEGLKMLGIMKGDTETAVQEGAHAVFFPCGLGHMLGLDTHDMENLGEKYVGYTETLTKSTRFGLKSLRLGRALEEGFVLTVEPGIYFNHLLSDEWQAKGLHTNFICYDKLDQYKNMGGIRVEEDVLITATGKRILGEPLVKTTADIETIAADG